MTREQAFEQVQRKVAELQDAVMRLHALHQDGTVGLEEWVGHNHNVLWELSEEIYAEAE